MNRAEYIHELARLLKRLPKEDYDRAMEYFVEYFEEAGPENEQQAIRDLGSPQLAADQIITDLAIHNADEKPASVKRGFSAVWVGVLAVFAAPIALPLAFAFVLVIAALFLVVISLIAALLITMVALAAAGIVGVFGGIYLMFHSFANGLATVGMSLMALGVGIPFSYGCILFCRWFLHKMTVIFGNFAKGGKKHEKNN